MAGRVMNAKQQPLTKLPAAEFPDNVPGIRIGPYMYLVARRKGNKHSSLFRWNFEDKTATVIARFTSEDEAQAFWDFLFSWATEYRAIVKLVGEHVIAHGEWLENSLIQKGRIAADERSE